MEKLPLYLTFTAAALANYEQTQEDSLIVLSRDANLFPVMIILCIWGHAAVQFVVEASLETYFCLGIVMGARGNHNQFSESLE
jgi:hypothetical protein